MLTADICTLITTTGIPAHKFVRLYDINILKYYNQFTIYMRLNYKGNIHNSNYYIKINQGTNELSMHWAHTDLAITDIAIAAYNGHLEILKWLYCGIKSSYCYEAAAIMQQFDVLKWLHANNFIMNVDKTLFAAIKTDRLDIVMWIVSITNQITSTFLFKSAILYGNLDMIKYFHNSGIYVDNAIEIAINSRKLDAAKWLYHSGRYPIKIIRVTYMLLTNLELLKWVDLHMPIRCSYTLISDYIYREEVKLDTIIYLHATHYTDDWQRCEYKGGKKGQWLQLNNLIL